jgi:hypothetical protein
LPSSFVLNGVCYTCDPSCSSCNGSSANNCIICQPLYYKNNGFCVLNCPSTKFSFSNSTCGCSVDCLTCNNASPTYCTNCKNSSLIAFNGKCIATCPQYTYLSNTTCASCPSNCISCISSISCTTCNSNYYFYNSNCYSDCNIISYQYDSKNGICVLCPTGCDTCNGTTCYSCLSSYSLNVT